MVTGNDRDFDRYANAGAPASASLRQAAAAGPAAAMAALDVELGVLGVDPHAGGLWPHLGVR